MWARERFSEILGYKKPLTTEQSDRVERAKKGLTLAYMTEKITLSQYIAALDALPKTLNLRKLAEGLKLKP